MPLWKTMYETKTTFNNPLNKLGAIDKEDNTIKEADLKRIIKEIIQSKNIEKELGEAVKSIATKENKSVEAANYKFDDIIPKAIPGKYNTACIEKDKIFVRLKSKENKIVCYTELNLPKKNHTYACQFLYIYVPRIIAYKDGYESEGTFLPWKECQAIYLELLNRKCDKWVTEMVVA